MLRSYLLFILLFIVYSPAFAQSFSGNFMHDGVLRYYRFYIPSGYNAATAYPLVFNLHGNGSTAQQQELYSQMNTVADTAKFIVVYPDGLANTWNSGFSFPYNSGTKDVQFISALIDTFSKNYNIDPERVYSCGMSMGGFMSYRLACDLHTRIAAIASVTGMMANQVGTNCQSQKPVPVLQIHGTLDATVPYSGTTGYTSVDQAVNFWVQKNNCPATPVVTNIPDIAAEGSTAEKYYYGLCDDDSEVVLFKVINGGHSWPGAFPVASLGITNQDFSASSEIWNFFNKHKLTPDTIVTGVSLECADLVVTSVAANSADSSKIDVTIENNCTNCDNSGISGPVYCEMVMIRTVAPFDTIAASNCWCYMTPPNNSSENYSVTKTDPLAAIPPVGEFRIAFDGCFCDTLTLDIEEVEVGVGEGGTKDQIRFFPNPAHDFLTITTPADATYTLGIFDITGKEVLNNKSGRKVFNIDVSALPAGFYLLKLVNSLSGEVLVGKVLKE